MTLTVRLDPEIEQELAAHCKREQVSKSEVVSELLKTFLKRRRPAKSFYEAAKEDGFFGCMDGVEDLSVNRKEYLRARQLTKRNR